jgi:prevent-host-death family protein
MTVMIGVRDLKNRASEIVREVREGGATYVVTVRGEPVAELRPLDAVERRRAEVNEALRKVDELAQQVTRAWKSPKSAVELIEEQRGR